ncbi:hypothetical protein HOH87_04095 [bacterium]|jgi:hypothetical protein|nr:hypothetical protein [bacterium]
MMPWLFLFALTKLYLTVASVEVSACLKALLFAGGNLNLRTLGKLAAATLPGASVFVFFAAVVFVLSLLEPADILSAPLFFDSPAGGSCCFICTCDR